MLRDSMKDGIARRLPPKKDIALHLLDRGDVFVHLDPRRPSVVVPASFVSQPQLVLQIGRNMRVPIPDLEVRDDGIGCTLAFRRVAHRCELPWPAIYALVGADGAGMVWPDDVPPELRGVVSGPVAGPAGGPARPPGLIQEVPDALVSWSLSVSDALRGNRVFMPPVTVGVGACPVTVAVHVEGSRPVLVVAARVAGAGEPGGGMSGPYRAQRRRARGLPPIVIRRRTRLSSLRAAFGLVRKLGTTDPIFDGAVIIETEAPAERVRSLLSRDEARTAILRLLSEGFGAVGFHHRGAAVAAVRPTPDPYLVEVDPLWSACSLVAELDRHADPDALGIQLKG